MKIVIHIPCINFSYVFGEAETEEQGRAMVLEHYGSEAIESTNITFE